MKKGDINMTCLDDLTKKYPFMYEVDDKVYQIGLGVFKECDSLIRKTYFMRYREFIKKVGRDNIVRDKLQGEEEEYLIYLFRKIKTYSELDEINILIGEVNKEIRMFIDSLNSEQKNNLGEQLEDYINSFWHYYKRF